VLSRPIIHHRTEEFRAIFQQVSEDLKTVFKSKNDVYCLASSGTGAMESSVVNCLSPRDPVLILSAGKWGERFCQIAKTYDLDADILERPYGEAIEPEAVKAALSKKSYKAVFATLCETSTAVVHDIEAIGNPAGTPNERRRTV